jgi:spore maturation protein CgeB
MRHYPNQRIFDVGACGRAVLGERLDGWSELFCSEQAELFFDDFDQLREKAARLAADRCRRWQLGAALRSHILLHHTFAHRLDRIFKIIYENNEDQCSQRVLQINC